MSETQINKRLEPAVKVSSMDQARIINSPMPRLDPNADPRLPPPPSVREGDRMGGGQPLRTAQPNVTFKRQPMEIDMRGGGPVVMQRPVPPINTQGDLRDPRDMRDPNAPAQRATQHSLQQKAAIIGHVVPPRTDLSIDQATLCACLVDAYLAAQIEAGAPPASLVLAKSALAALNQLIPSSVSSASGKDQATAAADGIEIDLTPSPVK